MSIIKSVRRGCKIFIIAVLLMIAPLPMNSILPVTVEAQASSFRMNQSAIWMNAGKTRKLKVYGAKGKVKWSSSNKEVAKVSSKGIVKAVDAGKAKITAKCTGLSKSVSCTVRVFSQASVKKKILKLKKKFPEGRYWTNENNYYFWEATYTHGYGCYAFVAEVSDLVFGVNAPLKRHTSFSKIKAGDHIRIGDYHSVTVIEKKGNTLIVVEGNYNSSVHWFRKITKSELNYSGFYVDTRYW